MLAPRRRPTPARFWAATLAILALLAQALVPLAQAAPGLQGADGRVLPLVLCRTAADPGGTPAPAGTDHAKRCVICQALDASGMAPPPVHPALHPLAPQLLSVVRPASGDPRDARYRRCPPARAPPAAASIV